MKTKLEEIVYLLLNSNKIKDKILGIEIANIFTKEKKNETKIIKIKDKLYLKLLSMLKEEITPLLENVINTVSTIANYITKTSGWSIDEKGNFHKDNLILIRNKEGYILDDNIYKYNFYIRYQSELQTINNMLNDKTTILQNNHNYKKDTDLRLVSLIREILKLDTKELTSVKRLYR